MGVHKLCNGRELSSTTKAVWGWGYGDLAAMLPDVRIFLSEREPRVFIHKQDVRLHLIRNRHHQQIVTMEIDGNRYILQKEESSIKIETSRLAKLDKML